ncbi:MAG: D-alanine--D-alanine ligase family protein, partial [Longimicrobiales bacterium]
AVDAALVALRHTPLRIPAAADSAWQTHVRERADAVFNLCEGVGGDASAEADVAAALESMNIPFTGAGAAALALARRKDRVNLLLTGAVPVPAWTIAAPDAIAAWQDYPAIVKPAGEDAGIGITGAAIAAGPRELERAIDDARAHTPLLVQRFLSGIELVVGFVGATPLPVAEVDYAAMPDGMPRVVGYAAKWEAGSREDLGTTTRCPARIDEALAAQAVDTARDAWRAIGNRGYARVDLRADQDGVLHVLDVNPNPDLAPDAGLARMAAAAGWSYGDLIDRILRAAMSDAAGIR